MSPYWGANFFEFFYILIVRIAHWNFSTLATDEVQIGVLGAVAVSCALLGPFLVLKRMAMFANSLSHTILLGIAGAVLLLGGTAMFDLSHLLLGALIAAIATAFFTEGLIKVFRLQEDASIGLVFTSLFALGIVLVTLYTRDLHLGIESVMGNADALMPSDLRLAATLMLINGCAIFLFFRHFQLASFDKSLAQTLGLRGGLFHFLLLFLAAATCIGAFRAVGVLLVLAFLVGPYLTARLFCHRLKYLLLWSALLGIGASLFGVALARHLLSVYDLPLSTGGIVACSIGLFYLIALAIRKIYLFTLARRCAIVNGA
jgi:manganese/zinc/iron transport system permease protein